MSPEEAEEFMREWGDWAKWSDARSMVQEAYGRGYVAGHAQGKRDALLTPVVKPSEGSDQ